MILLSQWGRLGRMACLMARLLESGKLWIVVWSSSLAAMIVWYLPAPHPLLKSRRLGHMAFPVARILESFKFWRLIWSSFLVTMIFWYVPVLDPFLRNTPSFHLDSDFHPLYFAKTLHFQGTKSINTASYFCESSHVQSHLIPKQIVYCNSQTSK